LNQTKSPFKWRHFEPTTILLCVRWYFQGVEAVNMIRKGQVKRLDKNDAVGQAKFVESLFSIAA
jgi:hypothetical protein